MLNRPLAPLAPNRRLATLAPTRRRALWRPPALRLAVLALLLAAAMAAGGLLGAPGTGEAQTTIDYDTDNDGLIEISNLAQLNAIRRNLNGQGNSEHADYIAAFPNRDTTSTGRMGCPSGTCTGYELLVDLDFDTDGDGDVDASDSSGAYWNSGAGWDPIAPGGTPLSTTFEGNGHVISNLFISRAAIDTIGLFGSANSSATIRNVGIKDANVTADDVGGILVGNNAGTVSASWTSGTISGDENIGGLAGVNSGTITVSYSTAGVTGSSTDATNNRHSGGLVGQNASAGTVTAGYFAGTLSNTIATNPFVGINQGTINSSYWDTTVSGVADDTESPVTYPEGRSTAQLQAAAAYGAATTDLFPSATWDANLDGTMGGDDPWHFGGRAEYPILKYERNYYGLTAQQTGVDYDTDDDNLIEITNLAQLNAIRYDLDSNGTDSARGDDALPAAAAFPGLGAGTECAPGCAGFELMANLDFDTNGSGMADAGDSYWNSGAGWTPIGGHSRTAYQSFTGTLEGNDYTISNLYINQSTSGDDDGYFAGLFGTVTGTIRNVGLVNPYVRNTRTGGRPAAGTQHSITTGALAGRNHLAQSTTTAAGTVSGSYVSGGSVASSQGIITGTDSVNNDVGCLLGQVYGIANTATVHVSDSWATCDASATGGDANSGYRVGGLIGGGRRATVSDSWAGGNVTLSWTTPPTEASITASSTAGGLVGDMLTLSQVIRSHATGNVGNRQTSTAGGLIGNTQGGVSVSQSFATGDVTSNNTAGGLIGYHFTGTLSASFATGAVTVASSSNDPIHAGGLAGIIRSNTVRACFATGPVTSQGTGTGAKNTGGLAGLMRLSATITASYASGAVSAAATAGTNNAGGLVGDFETLSTFIPTITASYARGAVSAAGGTTNQPGGLVGGATTGSITITNSYWDSSSTGTGQSSSTGSTTGGQTTSALQTPTEYGSTGIYMSWNVDLDNADSDNDLATGGDDPWHFGTASDYPILKYNMDATGLSRQLAPAPSGMVDYDADGDGLIAVATLAQLDAIRYDLDANGLVPSADADAALAYARAFPAMTARMGCAIACAGYELMANLDFDTGTPDDRTDDEFSGASNYGWDPLIISSTNTGYSGIFEGNGHTIANLYINLPTSVLLPSKVGLFGELERGAVIRGVGVVDASITRAKSTAGYAGVLVAHNWGTITDSYATGRIAYTPGSAAQNTRVGGLVGDNSTLSAITASYANVNISLNGGAGSWAGGLVGYNLGAATTASYAAGAVSVVSDNGRAGGLVAYSANSGMVSATITASYATGAVSGTGTNVTLGGLVGYNLGTIANSYWDTATAGAQVGVGGGAGTGAVGFTTDRLRGPTDYTGIYADWNVDLDEDGQVDNPWRFGNDTQYPVLHFARPDDDADFKDYDVDDDGLIEIRTVDQLNAVRYDLDGDGSSGSPAYNTAFMNRDPVAPNAMGCVAICRGYELAANLDFDTDGQDDGTYTIAAGVVTGDADDDYYNGGAGWTPIGGHGYNAGAAIRSRPYTAILEGNGYTIANLYLNLSTTADTTGYFVGLFGSISGTVRNVGLVNPYVHNTRTGSAPTENGDHMNTGVLAGSGSGAVSSSYVSAGSVTGRREGSASRQINNNVGCLLGASSGAVSSSWASCEATVGGQATSQVTYYVGGLVGQLRGTGALVSDSYAAGNVAIVPTGNNPGNNGYAGGLVGTMQASTRVDRSYATGSVSSEYRGALGGLVGLINGGGAGNLGAVSESFATGAVAGSSSNNQNAFDAGGLVGHITYGSVTASYASGNVSAGTNGSEAGGLVATLRNGSTITASFATGAVSSAGDGVEVGGLVGEMAGNVTSTVRASYATGAVNTTGGGTNDLGGLVGNVTATSHIITASYATGGVTATGTGHNIGGLVGGGTAASVTASYFDSTSGLAAGTGGGTGQTTAALQGPTAYGLATDTPPSIYAAWNLNLDGVSGGDDPWHFGSATQYPILQYRQDALGLARQSAPLPDAVDYDTDGDNLLEVATLTHLDALRYDLDGNGVSARTPAAARAYLAAFPGISAGMGCAGICRGYELAADADLDFDSDGDGAADGDYANWNPIGSASAPYAGVFRGNGRPIANLAITGTAEEPTEATEAGLFGAVSGDNALIEGVALTGVSLTPTYSNATPTTYSVGALVGQLGAATASGSVVRASYATGQITATASGGEPAVIAGGLVGRVHVGAAVAASYAGVAVTVDNPDATSSMASWAGGLVGVANGSITAAYATGTPAATESSRAGAAVGGLAGSTGMNAEISASYWDVDTGGIADDADDDPPEGKTTAELSAPTDYTGIYETWDDASLDSDPEADEPWDFGDACQYPVLSFGGHTAAAQRVNDAACPPSAGGETGGGEQEYVAPPIVYNLNIRFSVRRIDLDEGQSASYRVRLSEPPAGHAYRVSVSSDNPDVKPAPATLTFSASDWNEWQTVKITVARDANRSDESATVSHRGPGLSYGSILVAVNDTWPGSTSATVNGHTVTMRHTLDAPAGVTVTAPETLDTDLDITIGGPPADAPDGAPGYGIGQTAAARMLASIRVAGTPADGLSVCLPLAAALVDEAGEHPLTLLRYAEGRWSAVSDSERRDSGDGIGTELLCAAGVTEYGVFATAYTLPELGRVLNLTAAPGDEPGTLTLTWTPGANAIIHWIAGVKQTDPYRLAIWGPAAAAGSHTFTGLDSGSPYILTVTAGRGESDGSQWTAWAPWVYATPD